ncbi:MAG: DUF983 domain-containing protein [Verrucomicrobia bacterium]|nr:DUF983 domain-containing protein [Verrucomicrobiota bacterium]
MPVTRPQIVSRGLKNCCPNCGHQTLFQPGTRFTLNHECPDCGLKLDRGDGFFLGPFVINYTFTIACFIVPVILLSIFGVIGPATAIALGGACALVVPLLLYRTSWSWWLMTYFYFLPQKLPANRTDASDSDEE